MKKYTLALVAAALMATSGRALAADTPTMKLALQAFSLRKHTFMETIDMAAQAGFKYIEAYPGQKIGGNIDKAMGPDLNPQERAQVLSALKAKHLTLINFGVVNAKDEAGWARIFEFAKSMGVQTINSEPDPVLIPMIDKLAQQHGIDVAIHNHPTPSRYWNPKTVLDVVTNASPRIGGCADTGHWIRSGIDPIEGLRQFKGRLVTLHMKDLNKFAKNAHDVIWGTGISRLAQQIGELKNQGFQGVVTMEYEHITPQLLDEIAASVRFFEAASRMSGVDLAAGMVVVPDTFTTHIQDLWERPESDVSGLWPPMANDLFREEADRLP